MRFLSAFGFVLSVSVSIVAVPRAGEAQQPLAISEYISALDNSLAAVRSLKSDPGRADEIVRDLPSAWHVQIDGREFEVSTETLRQLLQTWQSKHEDAAFDRVIQYLELLRDEAAASDSTPPDSRPRHALLDSILSRREFHNVHGQTWMDRLKQQITDLLRKLFGQVISSSVIPAIGDVLVYALIFVAVLALAYWMYRSLREGQRLETIMPTPVPISAKAWPIWLSEARTAAAKGDWNNAIHLAYWGGISFLEAQGAWRPDVARTPREYLRLLDPKSEHNLVLRSMTTRLETVWYGMQLADENGFRQTIVELESLGCICN